MVQPVERAVVLPATKVVIDRAARRQVLRDRPPLTAGAEHIHQAVDHLALVHCALVAAALGPRDLRFDQPPFFVGQIARIPQSAAVVASTVLNSPHSTAAPRIDPAAMESQPTLGT